MADACHACHSSTSFGFGSNHVTFILITAIPEPKTCQEVPLPVSRFSQASPYCDLETAVRRTRMRRFYTSNQPVSGGPNLISVWKFPAHGLCDLSYWSISFGGTSWTPPLSLLTFLPLWFLLQGSTGTNELIPQLLPSIIDVKFQGLQLSPGALLKNKSNPTWLWGENYPPIDKDV